MSDIINRDKAIELTVSTIEKQFGKGAIMRLGAGDKLLKEIPPADRNNCLVKGFTVTVGLNQSRTQVGKTS